MNTKDQNFQDFVENVWQPGLDEQAAELPAWMEEWLDEAMRQVSLQSWLDDAIEAVLAGQ